MFEQYELEDIEQVRQCLTHVSRIAGRGAAAPDPNLVLLAMTHLMIVFEEPRPTFLCESRAQRMLHLLNFVDSPSHVFDAATILAYAARATWN